MAGVNKSSTILHKINTENKAVSWNELIISAQLEIRRIEDRAVQLREAIEIFKRRERDGEPCIGSHESVQLTATQN